MTNIMQKVRSITARTVIIASLVPVGLLAMSPAQAAHKGGGGSTSTAFCPCFSSTIIDATLAELSGGGLAGLLNGTNGYFRCEDLGDEVYITFNNADNSVSATVFGDLTYGSGSGWPRCGWSGRPIDTTTQEASECQNQIKQSWAWKVLGCPKP